MPERQAAAGDAVEVVYTLTADDLAALSRMRVKRRFGRWAAVVFWGFILFGLSYGVWVELSGARSEPAWLNRVLPACTVLMLVLRFVIGPIGNRWRFRALRLGENPVRLVATRETMKVHAGVADSTLAWPALWQIDRSPEHYFFWINNLQAFIVPLRAFKSDTERQRLWDMASQGLESRNAG